MSICLARLHFSIVSMHKFIIFQWKFINEVSEAENKKFEILPAAEVRFFLGKKKAEGVDENN